MNSIEELHVLNKAVRIFKQYQLSSEMYPEIKGGNYYVIHEETVKDLIQEIVDLFGAEHPAWNLGRNPPDEPFFDGD